MSDSIHYLPVDTGPENGPKDNSHLLMVYAVESLMFAIMVIVRGTWWPWS